MPPRKKRYILRKLCFVFLFTAVSFVAFGQSDKDISFFDSPFPPYVIGARGKAASGGIAVDIADEICTRMGLDCTVSLVPWKRALKMTRRGRSDGILTLLKTSERENFLVYTNNFISSREVVYWNKQNHPAFRWENYSDLKGLTIGLVSGYEYGIDFIEAVEDLDLTVEYIDSSELNVKKLISGRVDLIIEDEMVADFYIQQFPGAEESVGKLPKTIADYDYHMALSRSSAHVHRIDQFNSVLEEMKREGLVKSIIDHYTQ